MLLDAIPQPSPGRAARHQPLAAGEAASAAAAPAGCRFHPRCPFAIERCRVEAPVLAAAAPGHQAACHRQHELPAWQPLQAEAQGTSVAALRLALYARRKANATSPTP
jgi:oligopeptide/dipeptide ABC transporter ATP-binding protein